MFDTYGLQPSVALVFSEEKYMRAARNSNAYARFLSLEKPLRVQGIFKVTKLLLLWRLGCSVFFKSLAYVRAPERYALEKISLWRPHISKALYFPGILTQRPKIKKQ